MKVTALQKESPTARLQYDQTIDVKN